jgi:hypothetical protein
MPRKESCPYLAQNLVKLRKQNRKRQRSQAQLSGSFEPAKPLSHCQGLSATLIAHASNRV